MNTPRDGRLSPPRLLCGAQGVPADSEDPSPGTVTGMSIKNPTYDADAIKEQTVDVDVPTFENADNGDPAYVAVCKTTWVALHLLKDIERQQERGIDLTGVIDQDYVDALTEAFETGHRVLDHDDPMDDADLMDDVRRDVVPVARHFGIDADRLTPDDAVDDTGGDADR